MKIRYGLIAGVMMISLTACQENKTDTQKPLPQDYVQCKDPRPQACTREYNPVCAKKDNGVRCVTTPCPSTDDVTYATACTACADKDVDGYTPGGACPK